MGKRATSAVRANGAAMTDAPPPRPATAPAAADRPAEDPAAIDARGLRRVYGETVAADDITLRVERGEFVALLGASGSGKTTTLRMLAGFERPDRGELRLRGEVVADAHTFVPPERRRIGMVFQDYALFPHMNVRRNVAYGLDRDADRDARVREVLALTGLAAMGERGVHELSGGEQQRVALARALAPRPGLLLLDEPFSNLDTQLRGQVRAEVREIVRRSGVTAVLVTHDQEEALSVADRVAFLWRGRVEQVAPPDEIYLHPRTLAVAASIGDANVLAYPVAAGRVATPLGEYPAPPGATRAALVLRPEDIRPATPGDAAAGTPLPARVRSREYFGHDQVVSVALADGAALRMRLGPHDRLEPGAEVALRLTRPPLIFPLPGDAAAPPADGAET